MGLYWGQRGALVARREIQMSEWLRDVFHGRPWWMNAVMVFCAYMAFVYMPWDIFWKPVGQDQEVWFGYTFTGWGAKLTAIPHWFVYGAAVYGFRRHRPWLAPAAALYVIQVAVGMFVWPILQYGGLTGFVLGAIAVVPFAVLTMAFWNARQHFLAESHSLRDRYGEWGIVTGASAGLGIEFAWALARDGVNVVLTARREERLASLAVELEQQHGVETRVVAADLAAADGANRLASAVEEFAQRLATVVTTRELHSPRRPDSSARALLAAVFEGPQYMPIGFPFRLRMFMRPRRR